MGHILTCIDDNEELEDKTQEELAAFGNGPGAGLMDGLKKIQRVGESEEQKAKRIEKERRLVEPAKTLAPESIKIDFETFLTGDAVYGSPGTLGDFWSNLWAYVRQEHPILAMFTTHELDPFSRKERMIYFFNIFSWLFFVSIISRSVIIPSTTEETFYVALVTALLVEPYKFIQRFILECPCLHDQGFKAGEKIEEEVAVGSIGWFLELLGRGMTAIFTLASFVYIVVGIVIAVDLPDANDFIYSWLLSQAISFCFTSMLGLVFHVYWNYDAHKAAFEKRFGKFFPADVYSYTQVAKETKVQFGENPGGFERWDEWFNIEDHDDTSALEKV